MSDLIEKLESASEGSRELDALIWAHFQPEKVKVSRWYEPYGDRSGRSQVEFTLPPKRSRLVTSDTGPYRHAEPVTTSIDSALAVAERLGRDPSGLLHSAWSAVVRKYALHQRPFDGASYTQAIALAICAALLRATENTQ